eukprot:TRINITY_DN6115_c0_g1_i1.p1 TRINITY_DN6115_c0_g1~~TRINITY_DN6115_c0_g1_i1.p1  ORF type:complete len:321 (+),score=58.05 TRINITY_DN6115_c0_g1_i1:104-1066(+)
MARSRHLGGLRLALVFALLALHAWSASAERRSENGVENWVKNGATGSYLPVLMMHGYGGSASDFDDMLQFIAMEHPGTVAISLPLYEHYASDLVLDRQIEGVIDWLETNVASNETFADGYHLMCHSQGTLICRGVIERWREHRVNTFVSIAGPHLGQYGATVGAFAPFENFTTEYAWTVLYSRWAQATWSAAGYWHDPYHEKAYYNRCKFLPSLNNMVESDINSIQKRNFLKLNSTVLLGSSGDQVLVPWQTSMFGFFEVNNVDEVRPMQEQPVYLRDSFGLRTMHDRGSLVQHHPPGVLHSGWLHSQLLFRKFIAPYLS